MKKKTVRKATVRVRARPRACVPKVSTLDEEAETAAAVGVPVPGEEAETAAVVSVAVLDEQVDAAVPVNVVSLDDETSDDFMSEMIPLLRGWMRRQAKDNQTRPSAPTDAAIRARESSATSGLVRTLKELDGLARSREERGKKASTLDERILMERFIRRMDQLLADGAKASTPRKPDER